MERIAHQRFVGRAESQSGSFCLIVEGGTAAVDIGAGRSQREGPVIALSTVGRIIVEIESIQLRDKFLPLLHLESPVTTKSC